MSGSPRSRGDGPFRDPDADSGRRLLATIASILFVLPLVFMVTGSLRRAGLAPQVADLLPWPPAFSNYPRAYEVVDIPRQALNSFIVAALATPLSVVVASWAGLAAARASARVRAWVVGGSLVALMVPVTALLVGRFGVFKTLGLTNTFAPLVAPGLIGMSPFYVLVYYWTFRRIPNDLFDAARVEGLGPMKTWSRVAMPLVRPATTAVAVLAFAASWSNFFDPLIYLYDPDTYTLPLGLRSLVGLDREDLPLLLAAAVTATAPIVIGFIAVQRAFLGTERGGWLGR